MDIDLGRLLCCDYRPYGVASGGPENGVDSNSVARENIQSIVDQLFSLKPTFEDNSVLVALPNAKYALPREKKIPESGPETKWEKFAKAKGIQKKKKSKMVFDEGSGEYKPRFGYKSKANESLNDWCIEVKQGTDPYQDQYEARRQEKQGRVEKNRKQQEKNQIAGMKKSEEHLALLKTIDQAAKSSASAGKFIKQLPLESKVRKAKKSRT